MRWSLVHLKGVALSLHLCSCQPRFGHSERRLGTVPQLSGRSIELRRDVRRCCRFSASAIASGMDAGGTGRDAALVAGNLHQRPASKQSKASTVRCTHCMPAHTHTIAAALLTPRLTPIATRSSIHGSILALETRLTTRLLTHACTFEVIPPPDAGPGEAEPLER